MIHNGSCHCGKVTFTVEGDIEQVMECNCSHCRRKGYLLYFAAASKLNMSTPESELIAYTFNKHAIRHMFCSTCGCPPFGYGKDKHGNAVAAINVRCLPEVEFASLKIVPVDGKSF
ncbi:MAG: GFA family protein [Gammaproteobacteria bacterium]